MGDQQVFEELRAMALNSLLRCRRSLERIGDAVQACGPEQRPLVLAANFHLTHLGALLQGLADRLNAATDLTTKEAMEVAIEEMDRAGARLDDLEA
jgi:hypothetical protein